MSHYSAKLTRKLDAEAPQSFTLTLNTAQIEIVNRLYATGLYGNSVAEVVRRLLCDGMLPHVPKKSLTPNAQQP